MISFTLSIIIGLILSFIYFLEFEFGIIGNFFIFIMKVIAGISMGLFIGYAVQILGTPFAIEPVPIETHQLTTINTFDDRDCYLLLGQTRWGKNCTIKTTSKTEITVNKQRTWIVEENTTNPRIIKYTYEFKNKLINKFFICFEETAYKIIVPYDTVKYNY